MGAGPSVQGADTRTFSWGGAVLGDEHVDEQAAAERKQARKEARERYEEAETKSAQLADEALKANPLAKIFGLRKQVLALDEKNAALRKLERVERYLGGSSDGGAGPFPGLAAGVSLTLGTTGGLVVKRTPRIGSSIMGPSPVAQLKAATHESLISFRYWTALV